jgi:hypothetical protein
MKLLIFNSIELEDEDFESKWGVLYIEFNTSKLAVQFYVLFFVRRFIMSISFIILEDHHLAQVLTCSVACFMVIFI